MRTSNISTPVRENPNLQPCIAKIEGKLKENIKAGKGLKAEDKKALAKVGIKYAIANFLNEKTGGKFSFLRNWEANSAKKLLNQLNDSLSPLFAEKIQIRIESVCESLEKFPDLRTVNNVIGGGNIVLNDPLVKNLNNSLKNAQITIDLVKQALPYYSDLLTKVEIDKKPQTLNRLLTITGTLYNKNKVVQSVVDKVKDDLLKTIFSKENIKFLLGDFEQKVKGKLAMKHVFTEERIGSFFSKFAVCIEGLINLFKVKATIDNTIKKLVLTNPEYNLHKKELVQAEELLLYEGVRYFVDIKDAGWLSRKTTELKSCVGVYIQHLMEQRKGIKKLYNDEKLIKPIVKYGIKNISQQISEGQPIGMNLLIALLNKKDDIKNFYTDDAILQSILESAIDVIEEKVFKTDDAKEPKINKELKVNKKELLSAMLDHQAIKNLYKNTSFQTMFEIAIEVVKENVLNQVTNEKQLDKKIDTKKLIEAFLKKSEGKDCYKDSKLIGFAFDILKEISPKILSSKNFDINAILKDYCYRKGVEGYNAVINMGKNIVAATGETIVDGINKLGEGANAVVEVVQQAPQVAKEIVDEYNNMGGNILKKSLGPRAEEEFNEMFDELDESTQALVKTVEKQLKESFNDKIDKIKNPEEAIQKHENRAKPKATDDLKTLDGISALFHELDGNALKKHMQRADVQAKQNGYTLDDSTLDDINGLFSLNLSDLQKDFVAKDGEVLRDQLNVKAESLKNEHPIQDSGYTWTATYHLAETFRHMLLGNDLQIEINGQALNYEENSDDIAKEKVLALNNALNGNPGGTDGTSVVKSLSLLADEGTLLDFIPENLKTKFETNGLTLGTREKTSQIPDMRPNIHLKINKGNPLNAEINVTWHLLNGNNASQHTLGLNFATTLDLKTTSGWRFGGTIETAISSIKDLQYTFDGEKINEAKVA